MVTFVGTDADEAVRGGLQNDLLIGGGGNDTLFGSDGSDTLQGGAGDDLINPGDNFRGADGIDTGTGNDTVDFSDVMRGFHFLDYRNLGNGVQVDIDAAANTGTVDKFASGFDTLLNVARPLGASFSMNDGDRFGGFLMFGSDFDDTFTVSLAPDTFLALRGGQGNDTFNLSNTGFGFRNDGESTIDGFLRLSYINAPAGIVADLSTGIISDDGEGGADTVNGRVSEIEGSTFTDDITGSNVDESFILNGGDDTLDGGGGIDRLRYDRSGFGDGVSINLATGIVTGLWNGALFEHTISNIERVLGSEGDDVIIGSDGADEIAAGAGDDVITGGAGADVFLLGDTSFFGNSMGHDLITDFAIGVDSLDLVGLGTNPLDGRGLGLSEAEIAAAFAAATNTGAGARVDFTIFDSVTFAGLTAAQVAALVSLDQDQTGTAGADTLLGGDGNDTLRGLGGNDRLEGRAGDDLLLGGIGADQLLGGTGNDRLEGKRGNDQLFGGVGADTLLGGGGADTLEGGGGRDRLFGGPGNDRLDGGAGRDVLFGGAGADTFVLAQGGGRDRVNGFETGIDGLELDAGLLGGAATGAEVVAQFASVVAAGVRLDFGDGDSLLLAGLAGTAGLEDDIAIV